MGDIRYDLIANLMDSYGRGVDLRGHEEAASRLKRGDDIKAAVSEAVKGLGSNPTYDALVGAYAKGGDIEGVMKAKEGAGREKELADKEKERTLKNAKDAAKGVVDAFKNVGPENFPKVFPILQQAYPKHLGGLKAEDFHFGDRRDVMAVEIPPTVAPDGTAGGESPGWMVYDRNAGPEGAIHVVGRKDLQRKIDGQKALNDAEKIAVEKIKADTQRQRVKIEGEKAAAKKALEQGIRNQVQGELLVKYQAEGIDMRAPTPEQEKAFRQILSSANDMALRGVPIQEAVDKSLKKFHAGRTSGGGAKKARRLKYDSASGKFIE